MAGQGDNCSTLAKAAEARHHFCLDLPERNTAYRSFGLCSTLQVRGWSADRSTTQAGVGLWYGRATSGRCSGTLFSRVSCPSCTASAASHCRYGTRTVSLVESHCAACQKTHWHAPRRRKECSGTLTPATLFRSPQRPHQAHNRQRYPVFSPGDMQRKCQHNLYHLPCGAWQDSWHKASLPGDDHQEPQEVLQL